MFDQGEASKNEELVVEVTVPEKRMVSITEAARINNVTRQAIYVAIKQNKLKATKDGTRWFIDLTDLEQYRNSKYCRSKSIFEGEKVFDNDKGYYCN